MNFIIKAVSFAAFLCLTGCAAAKPASEPQPAPPDTTPAAPSLFLKVVNLPGWLHSPEAGPGEFILLNRAFQAQVQISTFTKEQGEPRDAVGWLMVQLVSQGAVIRGMSLEPGASTARLSFSVSVNGLPISGLAAAKWSSIDGIGFLVVGIWPEPNEPLLLPDFERLFESVDLSRE